MADRVDVARKQERVGVPEPALVALGAEGETAPASIAGLRVSAHAALALL